MARFPQVGDTFGPYTITGPLGQGHAGVVFRARRTDAEEPAEELALKVIRPRQAAQPGFADRFLEASREVARSTNEHVLGIRDVGRHAGCLFVATDLVPGGDLGTRLARGGALPPALAGALVEQAAAALVATHFSGLVHGNLKPANVLLGEREGRPHVYLGDFGIRPAPGTVGLDDYRAPECLAGAEPTAASDLYALGCILVAAVTGEAPYGGTDPEVAEQHLTSPVPAWEELTPVHARLNHLVRRSMAKDPATRYASAEDLRTDLLATGDPDSAPPAPPAPPPPAPPAAPPPAPPVPEEDPLPRPRTTPAALVGSLVALVLVVAAVVGAVALTRDGEEDPGEPSSGPSSSPSAVASATEGALKTCQEGTRQVPAGERCGEPYGLPGLRFVFPDITTDCVGARLNSDKFWQYECKDDGVTITYSTFRTNPINREHHEDEYQGQARTLASGLLQFGPEEMPDGSYQVTVMYDGTHPYAVSVDSEDAERSQEIVDGVTIRPPGAFRGD